MTGAALRPLGRKSKTMRYEAPQTIEAASALLAGAAGTARVLAGGTDLLVQLRSRLIEPDLVVDIKHIPGMRTIVAENGKTYGAPDPGKPAGNVKKQREHKEEKTDIDPETEAQLRALGYVGSSAK